MAWRLRATNAAAPCLPGHQPAQNLPTGVTLDARKASDNVSGIAGGLWKGTFDDEMASKLGVLAILRFSRGLFGIRSARLA